jgi:hypothetical protein
MAQITVTASTSVVLVNTLTSPNTVILLSSIQYPGHIVGIRDETGSSLINIQPIVVSTTNGLSFYDGTFSTVISQPFGSLSVSSKDSNTWQILNTQGYFTSLPNAYLSTLQSQYSFIETFSSIVESVSTATIGRIDITNTIFLAGNTEILGDISVNGSVDFFSTLQVNNLLSLSSGLTVAGNVETTSSLSVLGDITVGGTLSTLQNLIVKDTLQIDQEAFARGALLPKELSVQTLSMTLFNVGGGVQTASDISTQCNAFVGHDVVSLGSTLMQSSLTVGAMTATQGSFSLDSNLQTQTLSTLGYASFGKEISAQGPLTVQGTTSSLGNVMVERAVGVDEVSIFQDNTFVGGFSRFFDLSVAGDANVSSFHAVSTVLVQQDASSYGSTLVVQQELNVVDSFGIGGSLFATDAYASLSTGVSTLSNLGVGTTLSLGGELSIGCNASIRTTLHGLSTLVVGGTVSTSYLEAQGNLTVLGNLYIQQILAASTLGAPIDLSISTLTLSNTLYAKSWGKVPLLDTHENPIKILAGEGQANEGEDITVGGILNNRSTVDQTVYPDYSKLWYAPSLRASTIHANSNLSTFYVGQTTAVKPFQTFYGSLFTGVFSGPNNLFYSSNISTNYTVASNTFSGTNGGNKIVFNGSNQWVAVGDGFTTAQSILISPNGYSWAEAATGGFTVEGKSVAYGNGRWVAVGYTIGPGTIQTSTDGFNWSAASGGFISGGDDVAYNGSNLWVAAGTTPGQFGLKYSSNGTTWATATLIPPVPFDGKGVGFGGGRWVASDGLTKIITSVDGLNWTMSAMSLGKTTFAYNGFYFVAGGPVDITGNPTTSIHVSPNGSVWIPIATGGFQTACYDVHWDATNNLWLATGANSVPTSQIVQYSSNGLNWFTVDFTTDVGQGKGIGTGTIRAPDTDYYFTANLTTVMRSTLSSGTLYASTVKVSSIQSANLFGDGAGLSNINSFRSTLYASSFFAVRGFTADISAQVMTVETMLVKDSLTVIQNPFLSSVELWVAAGFDSQSNGNIQTSLTGSSWIRGAGTSFNYYAKAVAGNSNLSSPFYVAVGADSRTNYTIQWSQNARSWFPVFTGGFDVAVDGVRLGNTIAFNSNLGIWVAGGNNEGTSNTMFYSSDAQNWYPVNNAFTDSTQFVAASASGFIALGASVKYSGDGINWSNTATPVQLDTAAFGLATFGPFTSNVWLGTSNTTIYLSSNDGQTWGTTGFNTLSKIVSLVYGGSNWVGVGSNQVQFSSNGQVWGNVATTFAPDIIFNAVAFNSNQYRWVAGAVSTTADKSLWTSCNLQNWTAATSGGFSTSILAYGGGYSVFTSSTYTFAAGKGGFSGVTEPVQNILQLFSNGQAGDEQYITSNSLTLSNSSNVFKSIVRGIYGSENEPFSYVAVGDGDVPQKTIARSISGAEGSWIPAITGGFSTTGYGITHYNDIWLAVGDAQARSNVIQYSPDGANWFGTNTAQAIRLGGRGVGVGIGASSNIVVAVGKDSARSSIVYSSDGYSWNPAIGSFFNIQGNGVAGGCNASGPNFVAVGQDSRGSLSTILRSQNSIAWSNIASGGFNGQANGIAYGFLNPNHTYVAVGYDTNSNKTIQYSTDGGANFTQATSGAFTLAGYGVSFNTLSNLFFAVGEDVAALRKATIKYSSDGAIWKNISTGSGFLSQTTLGAAYGVYTQQILNTQVAPYVEFSNLVVYESPEALLYPIPTLRVQSSFMVVNESMYMNLSSQMIISSNVPYNESTVLTVYGNIYTSSLLYRGPFLPTDTLYVSSLFVSTLSSFNTVYSKYLTTSSFALNDIGASLPNYLSTFANTLYSYDIQASCNTNILNINNALYVTADMPIKQKIGIAFSSPLYDLDIDGIFGTSSFSTGYLFAPGFVQNQATSGEFLKDPYVSFVSGQEGEVVHASNSIFTTASSFTVNGVFSVNLSSQKIGIYTTNPEFTLDVRRQGYIQTLSTPVLNTSLLFLTLQSA